MTTNEKILIIRLSSIGDIVHCSGVPRTLKTAMPGAKIHWLVRSDNTELVKFNPHIDEVVVFDRNWGITGWLSLCKDLAKKGYTHVYDAHNNIRSRLLCFYLRPLFFVRRSKMRFKRFLLFWLKINKFPNPYISTSSYIEPLAGWGVVDDHRGGDLYLAPGTSEKVKLLIPQSSQKLVALAPATAWPKKTWPENYWRDLVTEILSKTDYNVLILGGPQDGFCQNLLVDPKRVFSLQGRLSLLESAAAAHLCSTLVVGDTGLLHMAESLGRSVVALLGPTPFGNPSLKKSVAIQEEIWCRPCSKDGSGICVNLNYQKCMKEISPHKVFATLQKQLENQ